MPEITPHHVAIAGRLGPTRHQADRGPVLRRHRQGARGFFQIEQAEIVLAALADDHLARLDFRVRVQPVELAINLALQVAGKCADPDSPVITLRPQAGGGDIAERLADTGAGFGENGIRRSFFVARPECQRHS